MKDFFNSLPISLSCDPISIQLYKGYNLAAPKSFWEVGEELRNAIIGGCGPDGVGDIFIPNKMYGLDMIAACAIHDWCFTVWNDKDGFVLANGLFKNNMIRINIAHNGWKWIKTLRLRRIYKYYLAVKNFGESSFYDSHLQYIE